MVGSPVDVEFLFRFRSHYKGSYCQRHNVIPTRGLEKSDLKQARDLVIQIRFAKMSKKLISSSCTTRRTQGLPHELWNS